MVNLSNLYANYFKKSIHVLNKPTIENIIESKRISLHELVEETGDLTHPCVVRLSQDIDEYMVQLQKIKLKKN